MACDSDSVNDRTHVIIHELFRVSTKHDLAKAHKQQGAQDWGLFTIAFITAICFKLSKISIDHFSRKPCSYTWCSALKEVFVSSGMWCMNTST